MLLLASSKGHEFQLTVSDIKEVWQHKMLSLYSNKSTRHNSNLIGGKQPPIHEVQEAVL